MIQKSYAFEILFVWDSTDKEVLGMGFEKWQIKIKKHGLGQTIP